MDGDTMEMLRAVLDSNGWLATHVVCVTLGYSATFLAGFLALAYIARGLSTTSLNADMARALSRMVYGTICFATLFSFVGDSWRHLGRSVVGTLLGTGSERERRATRRNVERENSRIAAGAAGTARPHGDGRLWKCCH